jgi:hypothetical protein
VIGKLIADNERVRKMWDRAVRRESGNPTFGAKPQKTTIVDNIHDRPAGTSTDAGLRRLDKAAERGDAKAADMLRRTTQ